MGGGEKKNKTAKTHGELVVSDVVGSSSFVDGPGVSSVCAASFSDG